MLKAACLIARKDLRLVLSRGAGLVQALLLGLLLIFVFSLSRETGETMSGQGAATIFWLSSALCQVLSFNMLYGPGCCSCPRRSSPCCSARRRRACASS